MSPGLGQVGAGEGHPERRDRHRQTDLPREHKEFEADPGADGVTPDNVRHIVVQLLVEDGEQVGRKSVDGLVLVMFQQLVSAGEIKRADLNLLVLFRPVNQRSSCAREIRLSAPCVVEAQNPQLRLVQRIAEDLVLHQVQRKLILLFLFLGHRFDFLLQHFVHAHGARGRSRPTCLFRRRAGHGRRRCRRCSPGGIYLDEELLARNL
mmetsp:Transcript_65646/g.129124  ORF Transcript_65646/g.129124 Transcript_65646/m.129124 type:complete len:207 (-) Transcript_65646:259-879(-)